MEKNGNYKLTNPQKSIWYTEEYYKETTINNICATEIIYEIIDENVLKQAINNVVKKNDSFRINIKLENDNPVQNIIEYKPFDIEVAHIKNEEQIKDIENEGINHKFNIIGSCLYYFKIFILENGYGGFAITVNHIISDSWTMGIVAKSVIQEYHAILNNEIIPDVENSYIDYIKVEQEYKQSKKYDSDKKYWNDLFETIPETATIPSNKKTTKDLSCKGKRKAFLLDSHIVKEIKDYCANNKVSVFNFLMALYSIYIGRVSNLEEFVIGTPILNRSNFKEKQTMGMFINTAPVKIALPQNTSFTEFVRNLSSKMMGILKHQKYSYNQILEDLRSKNSNISVLYNILISYQITKAYDKEFGNYKTDWIFNGYCSNDIEIHITDLNDTGDLKISYDYLIDKYNENDIEDVHTRVVYMIEQVLKNSDILSDHIEIVTPEEKNRILYEFNNTSVSYPQDKTISQLFEEQVEKTPDNLALVFENQELTYKELNEKVNSLANYLINSGITRNSIVGIMVNRSLEMIIGILAILKAGGAYIPIDPTYPQERIKYMLENSNAKMLLTQKKLENKINFENKTYIDLNNKEIYSYACGNLQNINKPEDLAYVIYTSGSTGKPKGVMLKHRALSNLANYCNRYIEYLKNPKNKTIVSITTISFDIFIFETIISLQRGLKLVIANENEQNMPQELNKLIEKHHIEAIQSTPSRMQIFLNNIKDMPALKQLRYVTLAGEPLPSGLVKKLHKLSNITVYNGYGPSETTVFSTLTKMEYDNITIGKPLDNTQIYILDRNMSIVPIGTSGEICIAGDGVGKGYINNEILTQKGFIPNPYKENSIMYRTGDLGLYTEEGNIICLGRIDNQIKIRGQRVELGEIEDIISKISGIKTCVVVKNTNELSHEYLCAYYTADTEIDESIINKQLELALPKYMMPQYYIQLKEIPYTPNGKIDRKNLPNPEITKQKREIVNPTNNIEKGIIEICKDLLHKKAISVKDSFFSIGGDSLSAINLSIKLKNKFKTDILVKDILENPTIEEISKIIENKNTTIETQEIPIAPKAESYPISSAQKRIYSASKVAGNDTILYNLPGGTILEGEIDTKKLEECIKILINRHEALRTYFETDGEKIVQKIKENVDYKLEIIDGENYENIDEFFKKFVQPFDFKKAPLFRTKFIKFTNGKSVLFFDMHHIISDGTSLKIFTDELCKLYNGDVLKKNSITYKDYSVYENELITSNKFKEAEEYWLKQFKGELPVLNMPTNGERPAIQSFEGKKVYSKIDKRTQEKIKKLAVELNITPYMLMLSAYYVLLSKYTGNEDIIVGTPIVGRSLLDVYYIIGAFVNTLPLREKIDKDISFKAFIKQVKENVTNAYVYQEYPLDELVTKLKIKRDASRNPLFDTMFIYQNNGYKELVLNGVKAKYYIPDTNIAKFDLSLEIIPNEDGINISFEYATKLFDEIFIKRLAEHYINIIDVITENIETKISEINMLSPEEQNKILYEFNNTSISYPQEKTISKLFEEQVEKTPNNIAVVFEEQKLTYRELNEKANSLAYYLRKNGINRNDLVGIMVNRSMEMIVSILAVLKAGGAYIPIDPTYPKERIEYMLNNSNTKKLLTQKKLSNITDFEQKVFVDLTNNEIYGLINENIENINNPEDLAYVIYTSGSTGKPKGVMLMHKNIVNFIYGMMKIFKFSNKDTIASITTMSFDIFVLESLMPLLNGLKVVIANEKEQTSAEQFNKLCIKNNVNIFQTTPSRMQVFMLEDKIDYIKNATHILIGGEPFPKKLLNNLKNITKAQIYNMYGPTETAVWSMVKNLNDSEHINIGKPIINTQIYILDKYLKPVPIGTVGEIYISGDGVSKGYFNNKELTSKSFIQNPFKEHTEMYKTGDMGKYSPNGEIICLGRQDNQIKMRGLRIELGEIENKICAIKDINSCVVIKKEDKQSKEFLCAYFTAQNEIDINDIRNILKNQLPKYMIPRSFMQMKSLPYTPNGKIDRKQLPEPEDIRTEISLPRNIVDSKLIEILKDMLEIDKISIDDSFFEIGIDSLYAINYCARIKKEFDQEIFVRDIIEHPTIREISDMLSKGMGKYSNIMIEKVKKSEYYQVSSAQKRMYYISQIAGDSSILYNITGGVILEEKIDTERLEECIKKIIDRQESLRTYFEIKDGNVVQKIMPSIDFKLDIMRNLQYEEIDTILENFIKPFDLKKAPLFRIKYMEFKNEKAALFIDIHHIISDGMSISIIINEISKLYNKEELQELKFTYKDYAVFENKRLETEKLKEAENYWLNQFNGEIPVLDLPTNYQRPVIQSFEGKRIHYKIDKETTIKIEKLTQELGVTPYMLLLSAYYILLSKYTSSEDIIVGSPIVGRDITDTYDLIGMFVNTLALRQKIQTQHTFREFLKKVKDNVLDAYKYQIYPFDELVNKLNVKRDTSRNPLFDVMFIYQNNKYKEIEFQGIKSKYYIPDTNISKFDLSLEAIPHNGEIQLSFEYATKLFKEEFIKDFSKHYINILQNILENADIKLKDINILSKEEENKILYKFNETKVIYPKDKTLSKMFEEQVEKTPDNIAIAFGEQKLTYRELNKKANSLAFYLRKSGINRNELIGIMVNRSLEVIVAILAVLKAGGAYIPIDPTFPKDRINYMLNNSNSKILLTTQKLERKIEFDNKVSIDLDNNDIYNLPNENIENINDPEDLFYVIYTSGSTGRPKGVMIKHKTMTNFTNYCNNYVEYLKNPQGQAIVSITTVSFDIFVYETLISLQKGLKVVIANENEQTTPKLLNDLMQKHNVKIIQSTPSIMQIFINNINDIPMLKNIEFMIFAGEQLPLNLVQYLHNLTDVTIYNGYGPSETYYATFTKMDNDIITIGKPLDNIQIYILDKDLMPVPIGVTGELYISGDGVAKGYLNNEELTNKSFINNPFIRGEIMYKSGDLGKYMEDGNILCLGRVDHQIKIRGQRIELGEIEALILKYPNIKKATVVKQSIQNRDFISSYFVTDKRIVISELRKYLSNSLPKYMIPSYFVPVEEFPYTPNGKVDKKALPLPTEIANLDTENYVAPTTDIQRKLVNIWEKVLNIKPIGINDNFFELGGDSILAMNLNIEILKISNKITYSDIFRYPTIVEQEKKINSSENTIMFSKIENLSDNYVEVLENNRKKDKIHKWHPKGVLLTGGTGFLGIHILEEFIKNEECNIYCIIRDEPGITAKNKLQQKLNYYFGNKYDDLIDRRVFAVKGNISEIDFGLDKDEIYKLSNSIDVVINSAARVTHYGNYDDFYNTNVKSVKYMIEFCKRFIKKMYHISTIGVAGSTLDSNSLLYKNKRNVVFDESCLYIGQTLDNVYSRSKFEAESYVLDAISNGLDGYILRMGNLMPRYKDGFFQENILDNAFINNLAAFINIGIIPDYLLKTQLEFTPIDDAAESVYKLVTHQTQKNRVFHLYNHKTISTIKYIRKLKKQNYKVDVLKENEFKDRIRMIIQNEETKNMLNNIANEFDENMHLNYNSNIRIKSDFTIRYLKNTHFKWHRISKKYISRFIELLRKVI